MSDGKVICERFKSGKCNGGFISKCGHHEPHAPKLECSSAYCNAGCYGEHLVKCVPVEGEEEGK